MGLIQVSGIRLYAYHGCLMEEAKIGGEYVVDITIKSDLAVPAENDELTSTVDYVKVNQVVKEEMAQRSKLIEHVAGRILKSLRSQFPRTGKIQVKVSKLTPPIKGNVDYVSVSISG